MLIFSGYYGSRAGCQAPGKAKKVAIGKSYCHDQLFFAYFLLTFATLR
jgi:hypothetical protein